MRRRLQPRPGPATASASPSPSPSLLAQLPLGGRSIFPRYRVVAYYGSTGGSALGVLGKGTPEQAAAAILHAAAPYAAYCRPVQPAMELIANVAQAHAGADGTYSYRSRTRPSPATWRRPAGTRCCCCSTCSPDGRTSA